MVTTNNLEKINRISNEALREKTGKSWEEWFKILKIAGADNLSHKQIAEYLEQQEKINPWWAQMVTVGFEQYHGKRDVHQKPNGYEISVSKTVASPISILFHACYDESQRKKWLSEKLVIRRSVDNKSLRMTWVDGISELVINFYEKAAHKSQLVVQHSKLSDAKSAEEKKLFWKNALDKLSKMLTT